MKAEFMTITPELAKIWLDTSDGNPRWAGNAKKVDEKMVKKISDDIKEGNWSPGNNSIAFDEHGHLIDGHHRLSAVVMSGIPVKSLVVFDVPKSGFQHIDENRSRTVAQRTGIDSRIVAVANVDFWTRTGISRTCQSSEVISKWVQNHPLVFQAYSISQKGKIHGIARKAPVIHGILCAMECGVSESVLTTFTESVNSGFTESESQSAAIVLRNMLLEYTRTARQNAVQLSKDTQSAIFDYVRSVPRKRPYNSKNGVYSDMLNL